VCHVQLWPVTSFQVEITRLGIEYNFQLRILVFIDKNNPSCNSSVYGCVINTQISQEEEKGRCLTQ
jgi:hypothetical protein